MKKGGATEEWNKAHKDHTLSERQKRTAKSDKYDQAIKKNDLDDKKARVNLNNAEFDNELIKGFNIIIYVKKGSRAAYVEELSYFPEQYELLIDKECV